MFSLFIKPGIQSILFTSLIALQIAIVFDANANSGKKPNADTNTNHKAIIRGIDSGSVTEDNDPDGDNLLEVGAKLKIRDRDKGEAAFVPMTIYGNYGSLTINIDGHWNYAADNNQAVIQNLTNNTTLTDNLTVSSIDGTTHTVAIDIMGADEANSPAVISGVDSASVTEDVVDAGTNNLEVGGKLNITDSDAGEAAFIAIVHNGNGNFGSYGQLVITTGGDWWYYASNSQAVIQNLASGASLTDSLTVSSVDGTTHTVMITIVGSDETNNAAVISGVDSGSVTEDVDPDADNLLEVSAQLNITDIDSGEAAFVDATSLGAYGNLTIDTAGNWNYAADNNQATIQGLASGATITDSLTVSSVDGTTHTVVITIMGADEEATTLSDISLSWVAPAEREDNTSISLSEISGYKIYYGTTPGSYPNSVTINDSTAEGHVFTDFTDGSYYFVVTTLDTEGRESSYSSEVIIIL